ncbi:Na+/H+ antiporter subunit A [Actinomycetospora endophytica]|uniref:Na+/H+ antiporter subunit A n=1 Tax=Actinomycetospora endophytica TaxID=2291215 RepID=A0ABS8P3H7_9PSEU|nr:Na+/H+ antiporter subunit A [Actinomycetospora endophytica]MCD2192649.1 Na+/H+ antiporter subunit A [Actinomycetospora endophytica]
MLVLIGVHALAALLAPSLVRALGRRAFLVLALVPAAAFVWILTRLPTVVAGGEVTEGFTWIPALGVDVAFRLDALSATLSLLVTGVGALVVLYCARYFTPSSGGLGRFAGVLTAFAGAMLALVWADDVVVLYVCWELTTIFSFLLVGQDAHKRASRAAAMQALIVTAAGGLTMLVGLVILAEAAGTYRLSGIVAAGPGLSGAAVTAGVVCVLVGALSKSALVPFQFWLPSAMAAPTPVSAFLHAAAMVKAGVYLVLRLAPGFADVGAWRPMIAVLAALTMLLGGVLAARQTDLKLLLAHGTVSQLGFMILLAGAGTRDAALAALGLVVAHALFKSTLFLTVGVIDRSAGTRDLRELSGLWRRAPVLATAGTLAAASMAGIPPLLGFVTKEGALEAFLHDAYGSYADLLLAVVVVGSVLTVAYSARFVAGAFTSAFTERAGTQWIRPGPLFVISPAVLGLACLVAGLAAPSLAPLLTRYADALAVSYPTLFVFDLVPGNAIALGLSVLAIVLGLGLALPRPAGWLAALRPLSAIRSEVTWRALVHAVEKGSLRVTAQTQRGSLAVVVCTILGVLLAGPGVALVASGALGEIRIDRLADSPAQVVAAVLAVASTAAAALARRRLAAVLLVGGLGYAVAVIFALGGAPDVALTQALVETMTLVVVVLVLRRLPADITEHHSPRRRLARLAIAAPIGVLLALLGAVALGARTVPPVSLAFPSQAYDFGAGQNVVNVTLVDIRAWDTIGELSVLLAAATGVASLVFLDRRTRVPARGTRRRTPVAPGPVGESSWLRGPTLERLARQLRPGPAVTERTLLLEVVTRLVFPTIMVLSVYFLFAGHNAPGGGFAGGLLAGLALVVRYVAGGRYELGEAAPVEAGTLLGAGLLLAGLSGFGGLLLGGEVLQTAVLQLDLPVLGHVKLVSSLVFDIGVYLIVVGLVLDILRSLGAELDRLGDSAVIPSEPGPGVRT